MTLELFRAAAVPSDTQIQCLVPSSARNASSPPKSTNELDSNRRERLWIHVLDHVGAGNCAVTTQGSAPVTESKDLKKKWPPSSSGRSLSAI